MKILSHVLACLAASTLAASAQKMQTPSGEAPGPWLLGTIGVGKAVDGTMKTTALKGLAIKVGEKGEVAVCYDLDLCRMAGAWTGGKFTTPMNLMSRGEYPTALGEVAFTTGEVAGFISGDAKEPWKDPRPEPFGPLPKSQARFKGFYVNGDKTILKWDIGGTDVLEMPGYEERGGLRQFTRTFEVGKLDRPLLIMIAEQAGDVTHSLSTGPELDKNTGAYLLFKDGSETVAVAAFSSDAPTLVTIEKAVFLSVPASKNRSRLSATIWRSLQSDVENLAAISREITRQPFPKAGSLTGLTNGGPARWPDPTTTTGTVSADKDAAYVVDTIKLPDPNPWGAPMFVGGFDFFADGRAAVCTFHGDVFIVSGIDDGLAKVTWRRFASGLYHALGLKIVKDEVYVTCRDGIWRLKDLNKDGEADFYEAFNHDVKVTKSFHEFVFDLQTDSAGNFYFIKAGPVKNGGRGFDQIMAHHGTLMSVSPDGSALEVFATGFRAPNGIGVGPHGEMTSGENEGTWTPACKINWINRGGFYGVVDLAHRDKPPEDYDRPLCWLPKRVDNSGGGQVWVTSNKWGPWRDRMLHLSYGTCSLLGVMHEGIDVPDAPDCCSHVIQGGVVRFPVKFESGIMRARFNPVDGQLYVAGLRGWQTTGLKNGCLQRVRYTGAPARMPVALHARKGVLEIVFSDELDPATVADVENWTLEQWNYIWSASYGSPEISTKAAADAPTELGKDGKPEWTSSQMGKNEHDPVTVKSAKLLPDKKTVVLEIPELKPVMQMSVKYRLKSADGAPVESEIVHTIHVLGE